MGIAFDNSTSGHIVNPGTTLTVPFTVGTGSDRIIYVMTIGDSASTSGITGVTYAGVSLTKLASHRVTPTIGRAFDVWYLVNPTSSNNNIVATRSSSAVISLAAASYSGVDQITPIPTFTTYSDSTSNTSVDGATITTTIANSWAIAPIREESGRVLTGGTGLTVRESTAGFGQHLGDSGSAISPAGSHTFNGTYSGNCSEAGILFELAEASAGVVANNSARRQFLMMM